MVRNPDTPTLNVVVAPEEAQALPMPTAADGVPKPATIAADPVASAEWDRMIAEGGVAPREAGVLAAYCSAFSRVELLRGKLNELGGEIFTLCESGAYKAHPVFGQLNAAERLLAAHAARLGLTPVDRGRVKNRDKAGKKPGGNLGRFAK